MLPSKAPAEGNVVFVLEVNLALRSARLKASSCHLYTQHRFLEISYRRVRNAKAGGLFFQKRPNIS